MRERRIGWSKNCNVSTYTVSDSVGDGGNEEEEEQCFQLHFCDWFVIRLSEYYTFWQKSAKYLYDSNQ